MKVVSPLIAHFQNKGYSKDYTSIPSKNFKTVVIPFTSAGAYALAIGKRMYFPHDTQLDRSVIKGLDAIVNTELANIQSIDGEIKDVLGQSALAKCYITLCNNKKEILATIPCGAANLPQNNGKHTFTDFADMVIGNSYLVFTDISGLAITSCFALKVYYE